ncbi:MAG: Nif3-like dinuclear metal center hexameric protein [Bacilli bacterium]|nr:Nif3-like dinuclear metal center hexameric protein [Bacilli bacterium]MBO4682941.1 Nif3-like dinuclear metal center hexameric protein [Bacilli bacterium]
MNGQRLITILGKRYPKSIAKKYGDFVGLMAGKIPQEVNRVLLCLDYDEEVHQIAKSYRPDLILTHHPFIYGTRYSVLKNDPMKKALYEEVIKEGFVVYSMHTNFDEAPNGMNDALSQALNLKEVYSPTCLPMMRIGYLDKEMEVKEFAKYAKECLKVNYGLLLPYGKPTVKKVGIVGGGGNDYYLEAIEEGCDIFISGDIPHHRRRGIISHQFNYLDLPHEIEKIFIPTMKNILHNINPSLDILCVDHEKEPLVI